MNRFTHPLSRAVAASLQLEDRIASEEPRTFGTDTSSTGTGSTLPAEGDGRNREHFKDLYGS